MTNEEYETFLARVTEYWEQNPSQRYGQAVYNLMRITWPELEDQVIHTELDCFDIDGRAPRLLKWLATGIPAVPARRP